MVAVEIAGLAADGTFDGLAAFRHVGLERRHKATVALQFGTRKMSVRGAI